MMTSKNDYLKEMENTLQTWTERLDQIALEAKTAKPERQRELQSFINTIEENKKFIEMQMKEIKKTEDNWLSLKDSVEGAAKNLDKNYRSALAYIM